MHISDINLVSWLQQLSLETESRNAAALPVVAGRINLPLPLPRMLQVQLTLSGYATRLSQRLAGCPSKLLARFVSLLPQQQQLLLFLLSFFFFGVKLTLKCAKCTTKTSKKHLHKKKKEIWNEEQIIRQRRKDFSLYVTPGRSGGALSAPHLRLATAAAGYDAQLLQFVCDISHSTVGPLAK